MDKIPSEAMFFSGGSPKETKKAEQKKVIDALKVTASRIQNQNNVWADEVNKINVQLGVLGLSAEKIHSLKARSAELEELLDDLQADRQLEMLSKEIAGLERDLYGSSKLDSGSPSFSFET